MILFFKYHPTSQKWFWHKKGHITTEELYKIWSEEYETTHSRIEDIWDSKTSFGNKIDLTLVELGIM